MQAVLQKYVAAGLSALPADRAQKRPLVSWRTFAERLPTAQELTQFPSGDGVCIVCGFASGGLEVIDFDKQAQEFPAWFQSIPLDLYQRLCVQVTQNGGKHVIYRHDGEPQGNQKLASELEGDKYRTLIETRGHGGLILCSPTPGYDVIQGDFLDLPRLTAEERNILIAAARTLDKCQPKASPVKPEAAAQKTSLPPAVSAAPLCDSKSPYDDYNQRGQEHLRGVLRKHGWVMTGVSGDNELWRRPGKDDGHSATFNGQKFFVHTSSCPEFEIGHGYSLAGTFAALEYGGDDKKAAKGLRDAGYGDQPRTVAVTSHDLDDEAEAEDISAEQLPAHFFDVGGIVSDVTELVLREANRTNRTIALTGALAFMSYLCGRKCKTSCGLYSNTFFVVLGRSGDGKEAPKTTLSRLAAQLGIMDGIADSAASGQGLEDHLAAMGNVFYVWDEFQNVTAAMSEGRIGPHTATADALLKMYSASSSVYRTRRKAINKESSGPTLIVNPCLTLLALAQPGGFYGSINEKLLQNGLMGRFLVMNGAEREQEHTPDFTGASDALLEQCMYWINQFETQTFGYTEQAVKVWREWDERYEAEILEHDHDESRRALWVRASEQAKKLALVYAASGYPSVALHNSRAPPMIPGAAMKWGCELIDFQKRDLMRQIDRFHYRSLYEKELKVIISAVHQTKAKGLSGAECRRIIQHWEPKKREAVLEDMLDGRGIACVQRKGKTKPTTVYIAAKYLTKEEREGV